MKKTSPIIALGAAFLAIAGVLIAPTPAQGALPLADDFDEYIVGNLGGQGGWQCQNGPAFGQIVDTAYESSPYSLLGGAGSCYNTNGESIEDGEVFIWINKDSQFASAWGLFDLIGEGEIYPTKSILSWLRNSSQLSDWSSVDSDWGQLIAGWNKIGIQWHYDATPANRWIKVSLNDGEYVEGSASFKEAIAAGSILTAPVVGYAFLGSNTYLDTIGSGIPPAVDSLSIFAPENNSTSSLDYLMFDWQVDEEAPEGCEYAQIWSCAGNYPECRTQCAGWGIPYEGELPDDWDCYFERTHLRPEDGAGQAITARFPLQEGQEVYHKSYLVKGWDDEEVCRWDYTVAVPNNPNIIATSEDGVFTYSLLSGEGFPEFPAGQDCSELSGLEKIVCEIKNFIYGIFAPSQGAMAGLSATMSDIGNRAPMNYLRASMDETRALWGGLSEGRAITFSVFGNSGNVDLSAWELGGVFSVADVVRAFFTFLFLIGFSFWAIGYLRRIFA